MGSLRPSGSPPTPLKESAEPLPVRAEPDTPLPRERGSGTAHPTPAPSERAAAAQNAEEPGLFAGAGQARTARALAKPFLVCFLMTLIFLVLPYRI